tara:strand:- start:914 stop:1153 length:240 start_codon:yes stop_codon:yes gene_type:complete
MSKVIGAAEAVESTKMVEIKHTRLMKDAEGNDVTVVDYSETISVDEAILQAEERKASLEASLADADKELEDLEAIRDAE